MEVFEKIAEMKKEEKTEAPKTEEVLAAISGVADTLSKIVDLLTKDSVEEVEEKTEEKEEEVDLDD